MQAAVRFCKPSTHRTEVGQAAHAAEILLQKKIHNRQQMDH